MKFETGNPPESDEYALNMEWIKETSKGVLLPVRAVPRAAKNEIQGIYGDALKVRLQAPPVEGKANAALIRFLSDALDISRSQISVASGETGRNKAVLITGISKANLMKKIGITD